VPFVVAIGLGACGGEPPPLSLVRPDGTPPNVLLVTIDTLRADHLGAYGYTNPTSAALDALAREGVVFTNAFTPVPTTAPALASLITGVHLARHRVATNGARLADEVRTLGESFADAGYRTAGFYGNGAIEKGFGQGLEVWEPFARGREAPDATGVARARAWIERAGQPWFLWLHLMDPHGPYDSSPPELSAALTYPADAAMLRELPLSARNYRYGMIPRYQGLPGVHRVVDYVRRYDGEIIGTDQALGALVEFLRERDLLAHTLIVVTADHGESLGENNLFFQHGHELNEASLRVPLVLRHPRLPAGRRIDAPASLLDVAPTVAALTGLAAPAGGAGLDLTPLIEGGAETERTLVAYTVTPNRLTAVRRGPWKLVGIPARAGPPDQFGRVGLYDTRASGEREVPKDAHPDLVAALQEALQASAADVRGDPTQAPTLTPEERDRLRALGYLD